MSLNLIKAEKAVSKIIDDLTDRGGLGDAWDQIDDEIRQEIISAWIMILMEEIG